ncbi:XRE family transcriptional regulator [Oscillospiraceae bacterium LTW-04]|nr:XRE family transcriptional regulator [Oscillospiraceae bacterium MB24-C1]
MSEVKICQYGKEIKKRLVDIDKTQEWLISQVSQDTGLYFDRSYLHKVMAGRNNNPKIKDSINKVLGMAG